MIKASEFRFPAITILSLLIVFSCVHASPPEKDSVMVYSEQWEESTLPDGSGLFFDIIRAVYKYHDMEMHFKLVPYKRSVISVQRGHADIAVGVYPQEVSDVVYPQQHFFVDDISAVSLKSSNFKWHGEQSLQGKRVAWLLGYSYSKYLSVDTNYYEIQDHKKALHLLSAGRFDYYIGPAIMVNDNMDPEKFNLDFIKWIKMYTVYSPTERGKTLARLWDDGFIALKQSGKIKALFEKYQLLDYYQFD